MDYIDVEIMWKRQRRAKKIGREWMGMKGMMEMVEGKKCKKGIEDRKGKKGMKNRIKDFAKKC